MDNVPLQINWEVTATLLCMVPVLQGKTRYWMNSPKPCSGCIYPRAFILTPEQLQVLAVSSTHLSYGTRKHGRQLQCWLHVIKLKTCKPQGLLLQREGPSWLPQALEKSQATREHAATKHPHWVHVGCHFEGCQQCTCKEFVYASFKTNHLPINQKGWCSEKISYRNLKCKINGVWQTLTQLTL